MSDKPKRNLEPVPSAHSSEGTARGLPAVYGRDHAALALLPFTLALREPTKHHGAVNFQYELDVDGRPRRLRVSLEPGESGVLPVHGDQMVYLALLQLALRDPDPRGDLTFRRHEVFELLRWPNAGRYYDKLEQSLKRLWELGITIRTAMVARDGREYNRTTDASRLINRYHIGSGRDAECFVQWGDLVKEAFALHDFKSLDWDLMLDLGKPLTAQLYRLLDRVTLSGYTRWEVDWHSLAQALGMSVESYARPAKLKQVLEPHFATLAEHGVIDSVDYQRGGSFVFHVRNYLRVQLRRVLVELGVYERAAEQLLSGWDETAIMAQCDCLQHGSRPRPKSPGGYLVEAIRNAYVLQYPKEEPEAFLALWEMLSERERERHHQAGVKLCGVGDSLFNTQPDPTAWEPDFRAVVRFMVCHNLDPEQILRTPATLGPQLRADPDRPQEG